jgi:hypothetical protein
MPIKSKKSKAKTTSSKKAKAGGALGRAVSAGKSLLGGSKGGGHRRSRGPAYWANKVLVQKLKKKYNRLKYGGM